MPFCKLADLRRDTKWSVINPTIYSRCFTAATRNPSRCELRLVFSHETKDCSHQELTESTIEGQLKSMEQSIQALVPAQLCPAVRLSGEMCRKWNRRDCNYLYCRHSHTCATHVGDLTQ